MEQIYIPPNVREDVKVGGIVTLTALFITGGVLLTAIVIGLTFYSKSPLKLLLFVAVPTFITLVCMIAEVPTWIRRLLYYMKEKNKVKTLDDIEHIDKYSGKCLLKDNEEAVFIHVDAAPWDICPDNTKQLRMTEFGEDIFSTVDEKGKVHINIQCTEADTNDLDRRFKKLGAYPKGLQELERDRIEHHYKLSKNARCFHYTVRVDHKPHKEKTVADRTYIEGDFLGGQAIDLKVNEHLTPDAPIERGEE